MLDMRLATHSIPIGLLLFCSAAELPQVFAQGGVPLWTNVFQGAVKGSAEPASLAVDNNGNVFVSGNLPSSNPSGARALAQYATVAYSSAGEPLWTNSFSGQLATTDSSGNLFG